MKDPRCMIGRHEWHTKLNREREPYEICSRCEKIGMIGSPLMAAANIPAHDRRLYPSRASGRTVRGRRHGMPSSSFGPGRLMTATASHDRRRHRLATPRSSGGTVRQRGAGCIS